MTAFWILTWDNLKNSLRAKKAMIFLVLYLLVFGLITYVFFNVQNHIEEQILAQGASSLQVSFMSNFVKNVLTNVGDGSKVIDFLFNVPPINIVLFFVSLIGTPFLLFIINYDRVSQEIYDGTIRYILFRATRFKIFFAKFFSGLLECSLITLLALFLGILWGSLKYSSVDFTVSMTYGLRYWFIAQVFLAVFVACTLLASAIFKKPFTSLVFCFIFYVFLVIIQFFIPYISPYDSVYFEGLFFHNSLPLLFSLAVYAGFTAIFLTAGYQIFKRKDL